MATPNSSPEIDNGFKHDKERSDSSTSESSDPSLFQAGQDLSVWDDGSFIETQESNFRQETEEPATQELFAPGLGLSEELNPTTKKFKFSPDLFEYSENEPGPSGEWTPQEPFSTGTPQTSTAMHEQMRYNTSSERSDLQTEQSIEPGPSGEWTPQETFSTETPQTSSISETQLATFDSASQRLELHTPQDYYSQMLTFSQEGNINFRQFSSIMDGRIIKIIHEECTDLRHIPNMAQTRHLYALIAQQFLNKYCMEIFPTNAEGRKQMKEKIEKEVEEKSR